MSSADRPRGRTTHPFRDPRPDDDNFLRLLGTLRRQVPFDTYGLTGLPFPGAGIGTGTILADNWPVRLRRQYIEDRWFDDCPVAARLRTALEPFTTGEAETEAEAGARRRRIFDLLGTELGREIAAIPVRWLGRSIGSATYRRKAPAFTPDELEMLDLGTPALHAAAAERWLPLPGNPLSARECDCLRAAADGLTTPEIAAALGIGARTANAHMTAAQIKLGAANRAQTIAIAMRRGLLE